jgi:hypothetical protein
VEPEPRTLHMRTIYYDHTGKKVLKTVAARIPVNAGAAAFKALRRNKYKASIVEVIDTRTGKLHSVLRMLVTGEIRTVFEHKHERKGE